MGRIVAIDYGHKRSGIAVTDELRIIATGLEAVPTAGLLDFLKRYVASNTVDCFVIGEPRQMDNTPSESVRFIDPFIRKLRSAFPSIPVERVDERFTSMIATRAIRDSGVRKKTRQDKSLVDLVSATLILQSYLEQTANR